MNIFILDDDMRLSAQYHCDKHIVKMPTETAQLLTTALAVVGVHTNGWKPTHLNHPCAIWARKSKQNFEWLCKFGLELCREYTFRYNKIIKSELQIKYCSVYSDKFPDVGLTQFAVCVPEQYKSNTVVESYRNYYIAEKWRLFKFKNRVVPFWIGGDL